MRAKVGLTGGIGAGKSTVASLFGELGAVVIDADVLAREVVEPATPGLRAIVERFGPHVLDPAGRLDRASLAGVVFADPQALADLNAIVHPLVRARSARLVAQAPDDAIVVQMIPLLVETQQAGDFDEVIVVDVPEQVQRRRVQERDGLTASQVDDRMRSQANRKERLAVATFVIDNHGSLDQTRRQVERVWESLNSRYPPP